MKRKRRTDAELTELRLKVERLREGGMLMREIAEALGVTLVSVQYCSLWVKNHDRRRGNGMPYFKKPIKAAA